MRRWQYITDEGLILGYISLFGALPTEELVGRLGKKRTTVLPKLYALKEEGKLERTTIASDWRARPYRLTDMGRRDVERYHLADAVKAYLDDLDIATPLKDRRRLLEAVKPQVADELLAPKALIEGSRAVLSTKRKKLKKR